MDRALRAAVIGLGRIGQGYDAGPVARNAVLTHAAAFARHPRFVLAGGADPDPGARARFTDRFDVPAWPTAEELAAAAPLDVIAIAVPTAEHPAALERALALDPVAVVCEKPLAPTASQGAAMVASCRAADCVLLVNYMRRFEPTVTDLRARLTAGELGAVGAGVGWYPDGLLENGSHLVDLVAFLLGPVERAEPTSAHPSSPAGRLYAGGAVVEVLPSPDGPAPVFQLELLGSEGAVRYVQSGSTIVTHRLVPSPVFAGEVVPDALGEGRATDLGRYGLHVLDALIRHLDGEAPLASDGSSALATLQACEALLP